MPFPLLAAAGAIGPSLLKGIGSFFGGKSKQKQEDAAYKNAVSDWQGMGYGNLAGKFDPTSTIGQFMQGQGPGAANPVMRSQGSSNMFSNTDSNFYQKSNPFVTGEYKGLEGLLKGSIEGRLRTGSDAGRMEAQAVRNANRTFKNIGASVENRAAAMGGFGPSAGAASAALEGQRGATISDLLSQVPDRVRANQGQDLGMLQGLIESFGKGTETQGQSSSRTRGGSSSDSSSFQEGGLNPADMFRLQYEMDHMAAKPGMQNKAGRGTGLLSGLFNSGGDMMQTYQAMGRPGVRMPDISHLLGRPL